MNVPSVSVVLPAYNCEKYIAKAIESVLHQTFTDLELIIINDGSTDRTEEVIKSFSDPRILYQVNNTNKGLVFTLNKGIDIAKGSYIARMDGDDICHPERLAKQKAFLDQNEEIAIIASTIDFINDKNENNGVWELDRQTITPEQIKKAMLRQNCIAHPTVMIRTEILKKLKYKEYQKNIEDYDLWLRLLNRGYKIAKLDEPLLLYRMHDDSVTSIHLKKTNPFFKHMWTKTKVLFSEMFSGHFSRFLLWVLLWAKIDFIKGIGKAIKNLFR